MVVPQLLLLMGCGHAEPSGECTAGPDVCAEVEAFVRAELGESLFAKARRTGGGHVVHTSRYEERWTLPTPLPDARMTIEVSIDRERGSPRWSYHEALPGCLFEVDRCGVEVSFERALHTAREAGLDVSTEHLQLSPLTGPYPTSTSWLVQVPKPLVPGLPIFGDSHTRFIAGEIDAVTGQCIDWVMAALP